MSILDMFRDGMVYQYEQFMGVARPIRATYKYGECKFTDRGTVWTPGEIGPILGFAAPGIGTFEPVPGGYEFHRE